MGQFRTTLWAATILTGIVAPGAAWAQAVPAQPTLGGQPVQDPARPSTPAQAEDSAQAEDDGRIGDVIVTAQRREEALSRVPVAATVVTGEAWAASGSFSVEDLEKVSPSLTFDTTTSARNNSVRIRGIGTNTTSSGIEPSTSTVIDGVVLIRPGQSSAAQLLDLERIEVLRGPQGTLFGKNASAGVVNIVTARPTRDLASRMDLLATDDGEYQVRGTVSGPVGETLAARISGFARHFDGNVTNVFDDSELNGADSYGVRGKLLFEPDDIGSALLTVDYGRTNSSCCARPIRELDLGVPSTIAGFGRAAIEGPFLAPVVPGVENRRVTNDTRSRDDSRSLLASLEMNLNLGEFTLTSVSSYQWFTIAQRLDDDLTSIGPVVGGQTFKQVILSDEVLDGVTQELRLASPQWGPADFVAGLYYFDASVDQVSSNARRRLATPRNQFSEYRSITNFLNYAAFGQVNIHPVDRITLIVGGRYTYDRVTNFYTRADDPLAPFRAGSIRYQLRNKAKDFSYRLGAEFTASQDVFFYGTYAQGYKGPGFNVSSNGTLADPPVRPETSDSYELGAKVKLFDRRLAINIAAFDATYDDFAVTAVDTVTNSVRLVNAAELKTRGVEVEAEARIGRNFTLTGAVGYVDSSISVLGTPCYELQTVAQGCTVRGSAGRLQDIDEGLVPNAAKWKWNVGGTWDIPLGAVKMTLRSNYSWTDRQQFQLNQNPDGLIGSYGILDGGIGISDVDDRYSLELFVKNATDRFYANSIGNVSELPGSTLQFIPRDASRYFGLRFAVRG